MADSAAATVKLTAGWPTDLQGHDACAVSSQHQQGQALVSVMAMPVMLPHIAETSQSQSQPPTLVASSTSVQFWAQQLRKLTK